MFARKPLLSRTLPLLVVLGLAATGLAACSKEEKQAEAVIRPVKVVEVAMADDATNLVYSGSVKARTEMNLGFRIAGKITERHANIGDRVKPGDVLMTLDPTDIELAIRRAEADLAAASQQQQTASDALARARQLFAQGTIAKAVLDQRVLAFEQAESQLTSARSALDQSKNQLAYTKLTADRPGIVTAVNADVGQVIGAGNLAVAVAVDGDKEVQIAVPEMDIALFSVGQTVRAGFWAEPSVSLKGEIREIAASADPVSRTFAVRVRLPDDARVLIGMTSTIEASIPHKDPGYTLPIAALSEINGKPVVWLVDAKSQTVAARNVTVTGYTDDGVRIKDGLKTGDLVVAAGTQFMTEKLKVRLPETQTGEISATGRQG